MTILLRLIAALLVACGLIGMYRCVSWESLIFAGSFGLLFMAWVDWMLAG